MSTGASQKVCLLSWNIDMDTAPVSGRTRAILHTIRQLNPDVIMLQEVTSVSYDILHVLWKPKEGSDRPRYELHVDPVWPTELPYFPLLLTRAGLLRDAHMDAHRFSASVMHRGYIAVWGSLSNGARPMFVTSHLESLKERSVERKDQLAQILQLTREHVDGGGVGVFAGDTNLREAEVPAREIIKKKTTKTAAPSKKKVKQDKFADAWVEAGASDEHKFTWDTMKNDNLDFGGDFKPRARYDRAFVLPDNRVVTRSFTTVGKEKLACGVYSSDHWGICINLDFL